MNNDKLKFILSKTYNYCSKAEKSVYDIKKYLYKENLSIDEINFIIDDLIGKNFINDKRYIEAFINDKIKINKWGKNKIIFELKAKNIDEKIINNHFNNIDLEVYEENLETLILKKLKNLKSEDEDTIKAKIISFALSKGYEYNIIYKAIKKLEKRNN